MKIVIEDNGVLHIFAEDDEFYRLIPLLREYMQVRPANTIFGNYFLCG